MPSPSTTTTKGDNLILWFDDIDNDDVPIVGGKNASLGEMYQQLSSRGVRVPNGFAVTAKAYRYFISSAGISDDIREALDGLDHTNTRDLEERGAKVRRLIRSSPLPSDLEDAILSAYHKMESLYGDNVDVAVRSSATAEDLPDASFAGQQETYLNVVGEKLLLASCKNCFASLFTNRAISYRVNKHFDHFDVALSICVQKMVRSDAASSGVIFTLDTDSGFKDVILVTGSWGLGENVVGGTVNPDEFLICKSKLKEGFSPIIQKKLGSKELTMIYHDSKYTRNTYTEKAKRESFCVSEEDVLLLARWASIIEDHYSNRRGCYTPMDIEWAKDGRTQELFIVQARPETVQSQRDFSTIRSYKLRRDDGMAPLEVLCTGTSIGSTIASGRAKVLKSVHEIHQFTPGEVLVTESTDPDWEPILKAASAVITNRGGRTCHAAIISRELGIPCMVGCTDATDAVSSGMDITIDCCTRGEVGVVYRGLQPFEVVEEAVGELPHTRTKICMNLANPETALLMSFIPNDGCGLARMEFIISNHIKAHPLALLHPERLSSDEDRAEVAHLIKPYSSGKEFFINKLAQGIAMIATGFAPNMVILRFSDFKTSEYRSLLGGDVFEPMEDNPMLGWRGASRYYDPKYKEGFAMECQAVRKVREQFGLTNLHVMVPFCRTTSEAEAVLAEMALNGLDRSAAGAALKVMGMCEIPANVILAEEFLSIFDGYSIGSNDLTQLTLGVDRNSDVIAHIFDERNEAVKRSIKSVIDVCNRLGKYVGICGQAPSDYPEFATFLVECGIQSISLNPDTVIKTTRMIAEKEKRLGNGVE